MGHAEIIPLGLCKAAGFNFLSLSGGSWLGKRIPAGPGAEHKMGLTRLSLGATWSSMAPLRVLGVFVCVDSGCYVDGMYWCGYVSLQL